MHTDVTPLHVDVTYTFWEMKYSFRRSLTIQIMPIVPIWISLRFLSLSNLPFDFYSVHFCQFVSICVHVLNDQKITFEEETALGLIIDVKLNDKVKFTTLIYSYWNSLLGIYPDGIHVFKICNIVVMFSKVQAVWTPVSLNVLYFI